MTQTIAYFAYGSNMLTARLRERVPSATRRHIGHLKVHTVAFHKHSLDGSGKATLTHSCAQVAHGCVFTISRDEKNSLDSAESLGKGYHEKAVLVQVGSELFEAFTYVAAPSHLDPTLQPYDWYLALVEAGAREHQLPEWVIEAYSSAERITDPDIDRAQKHWRILRESRAT